MSLFVKVLPKEICLQISRLINRTVDDQGDPVSEDSLLIWLPDHVFGKVYEVIRCTGMFDIADPEGDYFEWHVPTYFCEVVDRDKPKEE